MPAAPTHDLDTAARLRVAIAKLNRRLRPTAAGASAGLSPAGAAVLLTVARLGPIRPSELAAVEGLNPTMLSRLVADLGDRGLAKRVADPQDRRAALVKVSAEGRRLCERMRRERTAAVTAVLETLTDAQRSSLERALPVLEALVDRLGDRHS